MFCKHNYSYTQGYFFCKKCGKRHYGSTGSKRGAKIAAAITIPAVAMVLLFMLVDVDVGVDYAPEIELGQAATKDSVPVGQAGSGQGSALLSMLNSQDPITISDCMMRSNMADKITLHCGEFGSGEFATDEPIKTMVASSEVSHDGGIYTVSFATGSGQRHTYPITAPVGGSFGIPIDIPGVEVPKDLVPQITLPEVDLNTDFIPGPISVPEINLPDIRLPDINLEPTPTSIIESRQNIQYINQLRQESGRSAISFDERAYNLALARVQDINEYDYFDHTNPYTGSCPDTMKGQHGFGSHEYAAENLAGGTYSADSAVNLWMTSQGHRYNLLYSDHTSGATVCLAGTCVFLGVNDSLFGAGCYTGEEGEAWHANMGNCTDGDFERLDELNREYDALSLEYDRFPSTIASPHEYDKAMRMYDQLNELYDRIENFKC